MAGPFSGLSVLDNPMLYSFQFWSFGTGSRPYEESFGSALCFARAEAEPRAGAVYRFP